MRKIHSEETRDYERRESLKTEASNGAINASSNNISGFIECIGQRWKHTENYLCWKQ